MICNDIAMALVFVGGGVTMCATICYTVYKHHKGNRDEKQQQRQWNHERDMLEITNRGRD